MRTMKEIRKEHAVVRYQPRQGETHIKGKSGKLVKFQMLEISGCSLCAYLDSDHCSDTPCNNGYWEELPKPV